MPTEREIDVVFEEFAAAAAALGAAIDDLASAKADFANGRATAINQGIYGTGTNDMLRTNSKLAWDNAHSAAVENAEGRKRLADVRVELAKIKVARLDMHLRLMTITDARQAVSYATRAH